MSTKTPQEIYLESFYRGVERECRKHKINCSMNYDKIYIYTKFEEFYFIPNRSCITLMHRNISGSRQNKMEYHMQLSQKMTPEMVVKYVVRHTVDRYTLDGKRRTNEELAAFNPKKKDKKKGGLSNRQRKASYREWTDTLVNDLNKICPAYNIDIERKNNVVFLRTPYESFCFGLDPDKVIARNRKCKSLAIKDAYPMEDSEFQFETDVGAETMVDFVIDHKTVWNDDDYTTQFYDYLVERCDYSNLNHKLEKNRIYVTGDDNTYYFDIEFGKDIAIYKSGCLDPIKTMDKDDNPGSYVTAIRNDMNAKENAEIVEEKVEIAKSAEREEKKAAETARWKSRIRVGALAAIYIVSVVAAFVGGYMFALR